MADIPVTTSCEASVPLAHARVFEPAYRLTLELFQSTDRLHGVRFGGRLGG